MKNFKRIISVFLAVVMIAGIMAVALTSTDAAVPAWKTAYVNQVNKWGREIEWGWLKDIDGNGIPELFLSVMAFGNTQVNSYYNGKLVTVAASSYGQVLVQDNKFLLSWGRQGGYGDTVYRQNGKPSIAFDGTYTANNINFPEVSDYYFTFRYRFNQNSNYSIVSQAQYNSALNSVFNKSKAGVLNSKNCYRTASQIINAINKYVSPPAMPTVSLSNNSAGIYAGWNKVANAAKYNVFYKKASDSKWSSFQTTSNKAQLKGLKSGTLYYVQVQGVASNGAKGYYSKAKSMTFIAQPKITSLSYNGNNTLKYNSVGGANKYQIARKKSGDKSYTYFTTTNTSFSEYAVGGVAYTYQVRAMYATANSGTAYGAWSSSKSVATLVKPTLALSNQGNAVAANWSSVRGAAKYIVYFKSAAASGWKSATDKGTSLPITGVVNGTKYFVQVRPIGSTVNGPFSDVKSIVYYR